MKMVTRIALSNAKYHKSKNILTGIAIFLSTLLLFLVPTLGFDMINAQKAAINELYPAWHALFRNVTEDTMEKLSVHHLVDKYGLRSDVGYIVDEDSQIAMLYMDKNAMELYKITLSEGRLPEAENEIVVSPGLLQELSLEGEIGDTVTIPYQVFRDGGLDYETQKDFVICGLLSDTEGNIEQKSYSAMVSSAFLQKEIPKGQITYRFLFQTSAGSGDNTDLIEQNVKRLAEQFHIPEKDYRINTDYLWANYVDPSFLPVITVIMIVIVMAGMITLYSIYYISMSERVQELGKIKAIGATTGQLKKIVLMEGCLVAGITIPLGLLAGTALSSLIFMILLHTYQNAGMLVETIESMVQNGEIPILIPWIYLLTIGAAMLMVILSLLHPMKVASKVSEIEAMRYQDGQSAKKKRTGYQDLTVGRLAKIHLEGSRKKSIITICSMAITGLLFMVVATVLSCADPKEAANSSIMGEYELSPVIEFDNKENPELEWSEVQKNNPLTEELKEKILEIQGVRSVVCYYGTYAVSDVFGGSREGILGVPESGKEILEDGIIEGQISYEELESGDQVIIDKNLLYWYPNLKIGDSIDVIIENGDDRIEKTLKIAAIGDYSIGFTDYNYLIMASGGLKTLSNYSLNMYYHIYADQKYDEAVEKKLRELIEETGSLNIVTWKQYYDDWNSGIAFTRIGCYAFLGVLGVICIMNMINTMIHSVHIRKKELGILQAIGMSDSQLLRMLQLEGLFYTAGTLLIAIGGGSAIGYPIFIWAKDKGMFNIRSFHYPMEAALIMILVLVSVQVILTLVISKSIKKDSLIDRIRFTN